MDPSDLKRLLSEYGIRPSKRLGQHFLINERIIKRQIDYAAISSNDRVLEVGAGCGLLTQCLAKRAKRVIAIEKDARLVQLLEEKMPENVQILAGDALKIEFPKFDKIVANIPYQISSPLIFKLFDKDFSTAVLMLQKEFAQRLIAKPGDKTYSRLTVGAGIHAKCRILEHVPNTAFYPPPAISSSIVEITPYPHITIKSDKTIFLDMIRLLFNHRRKMIRNVLSRQPLGSATIASWQEKIADLPFGTRRVEELSIDELDNLCQYLVSE